MDDETFGKILRIGESEEFSELETDEDRRRLRQYLDEGTFDVEASNLPEFPLEDERHLDDWKEYRESCDDGLEFSFLRERLEQLKFPIRDGISESDIYANVVRKGEPFDDQDFSETLTLENPDDFTFDIYDHPAGALPVLITPNRDDFENLYRALGHQSEPKKISESVNAQTVAGLNNWDRVRRYKENWIEHNPKGELTVGWSEEMQRVSREDPEQFRDRIMLIYKAPYSGKTVEEIGVERSEEEWLEMSQTIRIEHEFTHYATKRLTGQMNKHVWDELLADYMGITKAMYTFDASLFMTLFGVADGVPHVDGRIRTYTNDLHDELIKLICQVLKEASTTLERITYESEEKGSRTKIFLDLLGSSLVDLALGNTDL